MDTKQIFLVTHDFEGDVFEVTSLRLWIKTDQDNWLLKRKKKSSWRILAAYDSRKDAQEHLEKIENKSRN